MEKVNLKTKILKKEIVKIFKNFGLSNNHALISSNALINAELVGAYGHGLSRLKMYCNRISKNLINPKPKIKIKKISPGIYELAVTVYLQKTQRSKALSDNRVDRYKVIWQTEFMGSLINEKVEYKRELSEFLLSNDKLIIKSQIAANGIIETQYYRTTQ